MKIILGEFTLALWYLEQAVRLAQEAKRLAIQSQCYANLSQELAKIYQVKEK